MINRFSIKHLPKIGTIVTIKPIKHITTNMTIEDYEQKFYGLKGIVVSIDTFNQTHNNTKNYLPIRKIKNLVPVKINEDHYLISPESLTIDIALAKKKITKKKTIKEHISDKIDKRIEQLKMQLLH